MRTTTILLSACLLACTGDSSNDEPPFEEAFPERCAASSCTVGPTITSANDLVAIIEATGDWLAVGPYTTGCLPASADLDVPGTVTVRGDDVAVPAFCAGLNDCRKAVRFRPRSLPYGVECLEPEQWFSYTLCAGITLRDTTIRLRAVQQDTHPSAFGNYAPIVDVLPACAAQCPASELACEATHTCWASARDQCAYCLGGDNKACACWDGERFAPNGTSCSFAVSGDVYVSGACYLGTCEERMTAVSANR